MTTATTASQPDARAETLVGAYERAGYRRVAARFASGRQGWVYAADESSDSE